MACTIERTKPSNAERWCIKVNEKKIAATGVTGTENGKKNFNRANGSTNAPRRQAVVSDILRSGIDGAMTAAEIAGLLGWEPRAVTRQVAAERRAGVPLCATCDGRNPGYFMASSAEEIDDYLNRLAHREAEIRRTRLALMAARAKLPGQVAMDLGGEVQ